MARENKKDNLQNLPACAADFINKIIKKMHYQRKVRRDVQAELIAHFEDALKDRDTNEKKEEKAGNIIAEFGDVKLLAILLRRAKKRCRPMWRTTIARSFQTVGLIFLFLIVYIIWFYTGKPAITTNYVREFNNIVRPASDESLNAAPLYDKAVELVKSRIDDDILKLIGTGWGALDSEQKSDIKTWINNNEEVLSLVTTGAHKPYYWHKYDENEDMMGIIIPNISDIRKLARILIWQARINAEQNRFEDSFEDIKTCYYLGRHLRGDITILEQLVGIAIENSAAQSLRDILSEYEIGREILEDVQRVFEQIIESEDFTLSFKAEQLFSYDVIQRSFTDGFGRDHIIPRCLEQLFPEVSIIATTETAMGLSPLSQEQPGLLMDFLSDIGDNASFIKKWIKMKGYLLFLHPDKQDTFRAIKHFYDYMEQMKFKTPAQLRAEGINLEEEMMEIVEGNLLLQESVPAVARVNVINYHNKAEIEASLLIVAILRFCKEHGNYPENLEDIIVKGFIKELPVDPFSDEPFIYKNTGDDFILYSVGEDFKDDSGEVYRDDRGRVRMWASTGDAVFWPVQEN